MAYILHIDTSGDTGLVALAKGGEILAVIENTDTRNHAAVLNNNVTELLAQGNIALQELDAIAVCGGPGSYTGLRIGLATAKGFCYALDKPLMMHNRLLLLAVKFADPAAGYDGIVSILQARTGEYFMAVYTNALDTLIAPQHVTEEKLADFAGMLPGRFLVTGYIDDAVSNAFTTNSTGICSGTVIDIKAWASYAANCSNKKVFVTLASSEPFYLKQVYTHKSKKTS